MTWPEPGWTPVQPFPFAAAKSAFTGLSDQEGRIALRYFRRTDGSVAATVSFGRLSQGAPGLVHGGAILTALDEALGAAAWVAGYPSLTVRLETEFRKGVPLEAKLLVATRLMSVRHGLVDLEGALVGPDDSHYASAYGRFKTLTKAELQALFGRDG